MGQENLKPYILNFDKNLFGSPVSNFVSMNEDILEGILQLCPEENAVLTAPFTKKEVYEAILQMKNNKAPGPDGFPTEFF